MALEFIVRSIEITSQPIVCREMADNFFCKTIREAIQFNNSKKNQSIVSNTLQNLRTFSTYFND